MKSKPLAKTPTFYRVCGKIGGRSTSKAKRAAARINGAKGGRPRTKKGNYAN